MNKFYFFKVEFILVAIILGGVLVIFCLWKELRGVCFAFAISFIGFFIKDKILLKYSSEERGEKWLMSFSIDFIITMFAILGCVLIFVYNLDEVFNVVNRGDKIFIEVEVKESFKELNSLLFSISIEKK